MKNKYLALFTAICLALIIYGLFSLHMALDVLWRPYQVANSQSAIGRVITRSGNKIEYYCI